MQNMEPCHPCRPLRIAVITETWPPEVNGVARTIHIMVAGLVQRGHRIEVVRPRQDSDCGSNSGEAHPPLPEMRLVHPIAVPGYRGVQLGLAWPGTLRRHWRAFRPDVVHVVTEGPLGWAAVIAARSLGIPVSSDFHTNFHSYSRHYGLGPLALPVAAMLRVMHNLCDCTLVPTREMQDRLAAEGYRRLAIVGRGVDTKLFTPERRRDDLRASWGCGPGHTVVMCVSRIAAEKNLELFMQAARAMQEINPLTRIVLVGDGPTLGAMRERHPDVVFAGMRKGEDLAAHYASADVFLFPSLTETFGNVTLEALASGLAVLAYDYAAAKEYIVDGITGLLAPFQEAEAFVHRARWMAGPTACLSGIRRSARSQAELLAWDRVIHDLEQALMRIADRRAANCPTASGATGTA